MMDLYFFYSPASVVLHSRRPFLPVIINVNDDDVADDDEEGGLCEHQQGMFQDLQQKS